MLSGILAVLTILITAAIMLGYARISSPRAAHRAAEQGKTLEAYLKSERIWAVAMIILALIMLVFATWYNLTIRV